MVSTKSGHPELSQWKYPLPGDSLIFRISRIIINVQNATEEISSIPEIVRLNMPPDQHGSSPRLRRPECRLSRLLLAKPLDAIASG